MPTSPEQFMSHATSHTDPAEAVDRLCQIYADGQTLLKSHFDKFINDD